MFIKKKTINIHPHNDSKLRRVAATENRYNFGQTMKFDKEMWVTHRESVCDYNGNVLNGNELTVVLDWEWKSLGITGML